MILGVNALKSRINSGSDPICIAPEPDLSSLEKKGSAGIDLHLGRWFVVRKITDRTEVDFKSNPHTRKHDTAEYFVPFGGKFVLHPRHFILAVTLEWVKMPQDILTYVQGKSSIGREGLIVETAPVVHPNFNGCLTLEMSNLGEIPLILKPKMPICQLTFHEVKEGYGGEKDKGGQFFQEIRPRFGKFS
jgi:dCTP deaminase